MNYRSIALVTGYHPCSFPPPLAYDAGLKERFAVVFSTYRPDKDGMYFDADLFVLIAGAIFQVVPHDSMNIEMNGGAPGLRAWPELTERYASQDEMERDAPLRIKVYRGKQLVAVEQTESWTEVGGPAPYHDSYTLSFYTAENLTVEFRRICETICRESGVTITAFHEAPSRKEPFVPLWRRALRMLGVKPW